MPSPFPWHYPYEPDSPRQRPVLRPLVRVRLIGTCASDREQALVDSGSEHIFADRWLAELAELAGIDLTHPHHEATIGLGGHFIDIAFVNVTMRLQHLGTDEEDFVEWETEVGFPDTWRAPWPVVLGQHGFFDRFTVNMHRAAAMTAIEDWDAFDCRFGTVSGG